MDERGFRESLTEREIPGAQATAFVELIARFETFLSEAGRSYGVETATADDADAFSAALIAEGRNDWDHYIALLRYATFTANRPLFVAVMEYLDGHEALGNLDRKVKEILGEAARNEIFEGVEIPPLGTPNAEKARRAQPVIERLQASDPVACQSILASGLRDLQDAWYENAKATFDEAGSVDAFLAVRRENFLAELEKHRDAGTWWFVQVITDEVIDYVHRHPEISTGVRDGSIVYEAKIPYMAKEYLEETDERMKRYYYCHCPWARESIRSEGPPVSSVFCNCSSAFHRKTWEVIFGQTLHAEVVESVLRGDPWCKFAIHLPDGAV